MYGGITKYSENERYLNFSFPKLRGKEPSKYYIRMVNRIRNHPLTKQISSRLDFDYR